LKKKIFLNEIIEKLINLSYFDNIKKNLPNSFEKFIKSSQNIIQNENLLNLLNNHEYDKIKSDYNFDVIFKTLLYLGFFNF
jgi:competence CoiA-like predicted nuclease